MKKLQRKRKYSPRNYSNRDYTKNKKKCQKCNKLFSPTSANSKVCNECRKRKCIYCGKEFIIQKYYLNTRHGKYCSHKCYLKDKWGYEKCKVCGNLIQSEKHIRYCSEKCLLKWRKQLSSKRAKERINKGKEIRLELIQKLGGECQKCGFSDERALEFHHLEKRKDYYYNSSRFIEFQKKNHKLQLLCANCHRILHKERGWK